ncbi:MAG: protein TolQ [Proteobacteria bacterium]|nr:protein TolQ [Pseudomonadota bacterium]
MTSPALSLLAAGTAARLDPLHLFLDADLLVQVVMAGLLLASLWVWTIVFSFALRLRKLRKRCDVYEGEFWQARDLDAFQSEHGQGDVPSARVVTAALGEWRRSLAAGKSVDREGARARLASAMEVVVAQEAEGLGERLTFLATVGSVAPFIGLFGTVWGIMSSFFQIGQEQNSSLAVVAPGIAEALAATAVGLFAAIPAVIAYNRFAAAVDRFEARLQRFADRFHASLSRELDGK